MRFSLNLPYGIACLIAFLLSFATACEAEPTSPRPATPEPAAEATSTRAPGPTLTPPPMPAPTAIPIAEVRGVRVSSPRHGQLQISWRATEPRPTDYQVNWTGLGDDFPPPSDQDGNAYTTLRVHLLTGLDAGTAYQVRVRARHWDGSNEDSIRNGPWSHVQVKRVIAPPLAPARLTAVATHRGVVLQWDDPGDDSIVDYEVVRARDEPLSAPSSVLTRSAETQYLDTDAVPDVPYVYTLRAINGEGRSPVSEAVHVTTLPRIPGRDDLYERISAPMAPAHVTWDWRGQRAGLREVVIDFTIHNDVGNWSENNGYYLMLMHTTISDTGFYFGLQTAISHPGSRRVKGVVFSRWETRDLANARVAPTDAWTQSAGYEGDFIGVRRAYDWSAGDYRARIAPDGLEADGEWFSVWITDLGTDATTWMGALKFPLVRGSALIRSDFITTLELYGGQTRPIDIPEWYVTVELPIADGVPAPAAVTDYPYDDSPNALLNSNVRFDLSESTAHFRIGGVTERDDRANRYSLR
jgi:hypothetical protein